jgi:hypothetical protein
MASESTDTELGLKLLAAVREWRDKYHPSCHESLYQCDHIYVECPELVDTLLGIVGYESQDEDESG